MPERERHRWIPLKVVLTYGVAAALWILFSDAAVRVFVPEAYQPFANTGKGWAFVLVTSAILYGVLLRYIRDIESGEGRLRMSERRLEHIVATMPSAVIIVSRDGRITGGNETAERMLRVSREELLSRTFDDVEWRAETLDARPLPPRDYPVARVLATGETVYDVRYQVVHPDGSRAILSTNAGPLLDERGEVEAVVTASRDVTGQYAAEQKLVHVNRLYSMLSQINEAIVRIRDEHELYEEACRITFEFGQFKLAWIGCIDFETLAVTPAGFAGEEQGYLDNILITVRDDDSGHGPVGTAARLGRTVVSNDIAHDPYMRPWADAAIERGFRSMAAFPLRIEDRIFGVFAIYAGEVAFFDAEETGLLEDLAEDIAFGVAHIRHEADRRAAEEELARYRDHLQELVDERTSELRDVNERLREATEAKSRFLASVSHELRTPLNSIIGFTGMMVQGMAGEFTDEQRKQLGMVYRAGKQLLGLVNGILDLTRIDAGGMPVERSAFTLDSLAGDVSATVRPLADEKGLALAVEVRDGGVTLDTDRDKLAQVVLNLLANAVKFTQTGEVRLTAAAVDGEAVLRVSDTGVGIAEADLGRIFDEFEQVGRATGGQTGTGLGLAISKRLVELLGGRITVKSTPGEGSAFTVRVPLVLPKATDDGSAS